MVKILRKSEANYEGEVPKFNAFIGQNIDISSLLHSKC